MRKSVALFVIALTSNIAETQNIYTALHLNENREYKTVKPKKIAETNIFYNSSGKQVNKAIKTFDEAGMLLVEERYNQEGRPEARLTYTNDTLNKRVLSRTFERWNRFGYYSKEIAFYSYDSSKFLIRATDKDANDNIIRRTEIRCNEKGLPVEMSVFDERGNSFGKETATYLYDRNRAVTKVFSNDGRLVSTDTLKINFKTGHLSQDSEEIYNANGDLVNWKSKRLDGTFIIYEEEYTYDKFGNCTENKIYEVTVKENGKRKREIDRIFKKKYTY